MSSKEKIMVILPRFPFPLEKGDKLRAYYQLRELALHYDITLVAISDHTVSEDSINRVSEFCSSIHIIRIRAMSIAWNILLCFFNDKPFQVGYFYSKRGRKIIKQLLEQDQYKHIYCQLIRTSEYAKDSFTIPKTIDYMDALSMGIERRIKKAPFYLKWLFREEARRLKQYERSIFDYFDNRTIISEQDRALIPHPDRSNIVCIPNGIDEYFFEAPRVHKEFDLVFVGNLSYPPNIDAVEYIAEKILKNAPHLTCLISGATPHPSVVKICRNTPQITLSGWVQDIRTSYCKGRIFIAPMMIGTGMQNKLLEAMALGIPCITTTLANNGINGKNRHSVLVADSAKEFTSSIMDLLSNPSLYDILASNGKKLVKDQYSWKKSTADLINLIENTNK